jgi:Kdo2-lipid IVA lauroyltransferase/acyltransferase
MHALSYYLAKPFLFLFQFLPFWLIYRIADFFCFFLYHIVRYRRHVIEDNLKKAFPEKNSKEIREICFQFYQYFSDLILEVVKTPGMSQRQSIERCKLQNPELLQLYAQKGQNIIIVMGHYGNWEWASPCMAYMTTFKTSVVYQKLNHPYFNQYLLALRTRYGINAVPREQITHSMRKLRNTINASIFVADQTPPNINHAFWVSFLNQETPFFQGVEKLGKLFNYPIIFASINKVKRGYYEVECKVLCESPKNTQEGEITSLFAKALENQIKQSPSYWLWSHRRWKHAKPALA